MKKEFIEVVLSIFAWRKRILKSLGVKKLQRFLHYLTWLRCFALPGLCQRARSRTDRRGELEQGLAFARVEPVVRSLRIRYYFVSPRFADRLITPQIIAGRERCTGRRIHWPVEREHPARVMRFDRNPLSNRFAARRALAGEGQCRRTGWRFPFQTFAVPHHDTAPVHRTERRDFAIGKLGAESCRRRISQNCNAPGRDPVGEASECSTLRRNLKSESGIDARKKEEQQDDKGHGLGEKFGSDANRWP